MDLSRTVSHFATLDFIAAQSKSPISRITGQVLLGRNPLYRLRRLPGVEDFGFNELGNREARKQGGWLGQSFL
jgi:hypothetical protein